MSLAIITGSAGLIGSEAVGYFVEKGMTVVGIDNDMRSRFFGEEASTAWNRDRLTAKHGKDYIHQSIDIRDDDAVDGLFKKYGGEISLILHTAAQPSHDWAAREPKTDFSVNANGTLNLLEATRNFAPNGVFVFTSTNKVYGDRPNSLPLVEQETRWEIDPAHTYEGGIREDMPLDQCMHSLFGASKVAADILVQEYGRYFDIPTACFRGGCLTGPGHSGTQLHGFLSYLMKCAMTGTKYTVFGYKGKQVRDNIHSHDLVRAFDAFLQNPRTSAVYNIGGGRHSNCSMLEAIQLCEQIGGNQMNWEYSEQNRAGDHIWWISDIGRFQSDYPEYELKYNVAEILQEIHDQNVERWAKAQANKS